jgi:hypothetical protein
VKKLKNSKVLEIQTSSRRAKVLLTCFCAKMQSLGANWGIFRGQNLPPRNLYGEEWEKCICAACCRSCDRTESSCCCPGRICVCQRCVLWCSDGYTAGSSANANNASPAGEKKTLLHVLPKQLHPLKRMTSICQVLLQSRTHHQQGLASFSHHCLACLPAINSVLSPVL